tara:strand:- start:20 stop:424 length:405 start_codon:yes stop_codon:yes gene_type:complete
MRIIHCKPYKGSSLTSYLFSQAQLYCEAFISDETFLTEIRRYIDASDNEEYLGYIKDDLADIIGRDYIGCLWLLYDRLESKPVKINMPLMAQYELKLMHDRLHYALKFQDVIFRFVPVHKTRYRMDKKPTQKAT